MKLSTLMHEYYSDIKSACISSDLLKLRQLNCNLEKTSDIQLTGTEFSQFTDYRWCCRVMLAHYHIRQERFADAIAIAAGILADIRGLESKCQPGMQLSELRISGKLNSLYILGLCKWLAPKHYVERVMTPRAMLTAWLEIQRELRREKPELPQRFRTLLMISGQTILQTGMRYCRLSSAPMLQSFNRQFGTSLNLVTRHYAFNPFLSQDCHLYWSIELAKLTSNGDLTTDELDYIVSMERASLLNSAMEDLDPEYAEISFRDLSAIISRRFCRPRARPIQLFCLLPQA